MDPTLLAVVLFLSVTLITSTILMVVRDLYAGRRLALQRRLGSDQDTTVVQQLPSAEGSRGSGFTNRIDRFFHRLTFEGGFTFAPEASFLMAAGVGILLGGSLFVWREDLLLAFAGLAVGMLVVIAVFAILRRRRLRRIREQLPDVVDSIARGVRAGESLDQSITSVGQSAGAPLGVEMCRVSKQLEMGLSMEAAMEGLIRRAPINEMRILAATFLVQRQAGGNLPLTLERLAKVIRDRLSYYRQFRAATAATRIGAILIALAGPAVIVFLATFQPDYLASFVEIRLGMILLFVAIILQVLGVVWIFRLLRTHY
jgi:tight adherence protein B